MRFSPRLPGNQIDGGRTAIYGRRYHVNHDSDDCPLRQHMAHFAELWIPLMDYQSLPNGRPDYREITRKNAMKCEGLRNKKICVSYCQQRGS